MHREASSQPISQPAAHAYLLINPLTIEKQLDKQVEGPGHGTPYIDS